MSAISKATSQAIASTILRYTDKKTAADIIQELAKIPGNSIFKEAVADLKVQFK